MAKKITRSTVLVTSLLTVLVGILSSALWDLLKWLFTWLGLWMVELLSHVSRTYKDDLYREVSNGFHELPSTLTFCIFFASVLGVYQLLLMRKANAFKINFPISSRLREFLDSKARQLLDSLICLFAMVFCLAIILQVFYINNVVTFSEKSIAIVSPYIEENARLMLWSEFYSISEAQDFYLFREKLEKIADENNLTLPELKSFQ